MNDETPNNANEPAAETKAENEPLRQEEVKADGAPAEEAKADGPPPPTWEYRKNFKVVDKMQKIVELTVEVSRAEIKRLRRQIDKLTYGS